jgi:xanthine dehydrogenase accessory factor
LTAEVTRVRDILKTITKWWEAGESLVFGAIDFAAAVARAGKFLGYHVTVCDARKVFATPSRFPEADEVVVDWPHRFLAGTDVDARTVICVLTHDPKFDVPLLEWRCVPRPGTSAQWAAGARTRTGWTGSARPA